MGIISSVVLGLALAAEEEVSPPELVMNFGDYANTLTMIDDSHLEGSQYYDVARSAI